MYAYKENGSWVEWDGRPLPLLADGTVLDVPREWADSEKRARFGLYKVLAAVVPAGKRVASYTIEDVDRWPTQVATFEDIAVVVPDFVSSRQFRLQLNASGLRAQVEQWVAAQDQDTRDAYEYSGDFYHTQPMMQAGFNALGFTPRQIAAFFINAKRL